jgi:DNA polymerase elongation subunit (family B)
LPYLCLDTNCNTMFGDASGYRSGKPHCPKCGGDKVLAPGRKSIRSIDPSLMPYRTYDKPLDPRTLPVFYKLSTFTDEDTQTDWMAIHKPKDNGDGNEILFARPPFKPYYFIDELGYSQNQSSIDGLLQQFHGSIDRKFKGFQAGGDHRPVIKVEFRSDPERKRSSYQIDKFVRCYQSNTPHTASILRDLDIQIKGYPTRMVWDSEVDPRNVPNLQRNDGRIILICGVGYKVGSGTSRLAGLNDNLMTGYINPSGDVVPHPVEGGVRQYVFRLTEDTDVSVARDVLRPFLKEAFNYSALMGFYSAKFDVPYTQIWIARLKLGFDFDFITVFDFHNIYTVLNTNNWDDRKFNLDSIATREFGEGEGKEKIKDYQVLWDWWVSKDPRLVSYCLQDADLVRRLDEKWSGIDSRLVATNLTNVRPDAYISYMPGIESITVKKLNKRNPSEVLYTPSGKRQSSTYEGAMVFDPVKGVHDNVVFLDAKAMYPHIIRTFNIGLDTLDPNGEIHTPKANFKNKPDSVSKEVLDELEKWREFYKAERDKYEVDSEKWSEFEKKQWVVKYYMVSYYGVLGSTWSFMYEPSVAEAITLLGQQILGCARHILQYMGYPVLYGDTDSLCLKLTDEEIFGYRPTEAQYKKFKARTCPKDTCRTPLDWNWKGDPVTGGPEGYCPNCKKVMMTVKLLKTLCLSRVLADVVERAVNYFAETRFHVLAPQMEFEVDKVYQWVYFTKVKKRYAGPMLWKGVPLPEPKLKITGFESKRTDWPKFIQSIQLRCFDLLGSHAPEKTVLDYVESELDSLYRGERDQDIIQKKVIRRKVEDYGKKMVDGIVVSNRGAIPPYVRAAKIMRDERHMDIRVAQQILYYMSMDKQVIPVYEDEPLPKLSKDFYDYTRKQVYAVLERMELPVGVIGNHSPEEVFAS